MSDLSTKISDQTLKLKIEIKYQNLFALLSQIDRYTNQRMLILGAYASNTTGLIYYLDQLLEDFRLTTLEREITNYINFELIGTQSLIDSLIELVVSSHSHFSPFSSAPTKMIYEFYLSVYHAVIQCNTFLKLSYDIREELTGGNISSFQLKLIHLKSCSVTIYHSERAICFFTT